MALYECDCGFGSRKGATEQSILEHVRGKHDLDVRLGNCHFAHCNEVTCTRSNGHGRRLGSWYALFQHLENRHYVCITEFPVEPESPVPFHECHCGFGSRNGATEQSIVDHVRGNHVESIQKLSKAPRVFRFCPVLQEALDYSVLTIDDDNSSWRIQPGDISVLEATGDTEPCLGQPFDLADIYKCACSRPPTDVVEALKQRQQLSSNSASTWV
eukprot:gene28773-31956_t